MAEKIKITKVASGLKRPDRQHRILQALGLRKMNQSVIHNATPQILGMVEKVKHLVKTEKV